MSQNHTVGKTHTTVANVAGCLICTYHQTQIVIKKESRRVTLNSGGYMTATTKTRMNQFSNQYCGGDYQVFQKGGKWFVTFNDETKEFFDGMEF